MTEFRRTLRAVRHDADDRILAELTGERIALEASGMVGQ
jgi:hypothetical protein